MHVHAVDLASFKVRGAYPTWLAPEVVVDREQQDVPQPDDHHVERGVDQAIGLVQRLAHRLPLRLVRLTMAFSPPATLPRASIRSVKSLSSMVILQDLTPFFIESDPLTLAFRAESTVLHLQSQA